MDAAITLWFNNMGQPWLDPIVMALTHPLAWMPLYVLLLCVMWRQMGWPRMAFVLMFVGLCVLAADQFASGLCKPLFHRLRPTHEPALEGLVRVVNEYRGGQYGFISSHAANTAAIATLLGLMLRRRWVSIVLTLYVGINSWTRLYLGVHYFGDIMAGLTAGILIGYVFYRLYSSNIVQETIDKQTHNT